MKKKFIYVRTTCLLLAIGKAAHITLSYSYNEDFRLQTLLFIFITLSILFSSGYFALEIAGRNLIIPFSIQIYNIIKSRVSSKTVNNQGKEQINQGNPNSEKFDEIIKYIRETFKNILHEEEINVFIKNIQSLISSNYSYSIVLNRRIPNLRTTDLYHIGWNIGKRIKKTNPQIALMLKESFPWQLSNVETTTIASKLATSEGSFIIPLSPVHLPLEPFPLAQKLGLC